MREALVQMIQTLAAQMGVTPTRDVFCARMGVSSDTVYEHGGYKALVRAAGLKTTWEKLPQDNTAMLEELRRVYGVTRTPLTMKAFQVHSSLSGAAIAARFGSWAKACKAAQIPCGGLEYGRVRLYVQKVVRAAVQEVFGPVQVISEHSFQDCRNPVTGRPLRFDFYIPTQNLLLEVDGWTHKNPAAYRRIFGTDHDDVVFRDSLKDAYALRQGFRLVRLDHNRLSQAYVVHSLSGTPNERSINPENCLETLPHPNSYNVAGNGERDTLENVGEKGNQQPSPCDESLGKVQRLGLTLNPFNEGHGDNSRQHGAVLFTIEEAQRDIPPERMRQLYEIERLSDHEIAKVTGYSYPTVNRLRTLVYRIKSRSNLESQKTTKMNYDVLRACLEKKMTYDQMENVLGMSRGIICRHVKRIRSQA